MSILLMIDKWPEFLQYIVLEEILPFTDIISISQTCQDLHQWVIESFRAYNTLCLWNVIKNDTILSEHNLYKNANERKLFQIIYRLQKDKKSFGDAAYDKNVPILDWWLIEKANAKTDVQLVYSENEIDHTSYYPKHLNILDWWLNAVIKC